MTLKGTYAPSPFLNPGAWGGSTENKNISACTNFKNLL
jgi:hypothetical protein